MQKIYDVVIIGAGITGAMTAYALAKYDLEVAVLEAGEDVASGTTKANSAIVHAGYDAKPGTLKARLNVEGCAMMPKIAQTLGVHYRQCGSHVVAFDDEDVEMLRVLKSRGELNGVHGLKIISADELRIDVAGVSDKAAASLFAPEAGIICPYDLAVAACENAASNGTDFIFNFKVAEIHDYLGVWAVSTRQGATLCADDCASSDTVFARYIVNAAGLYAVDIAQIAGEDSFPVKIIPRRGEYMLLDRDAHITDRVMFACPSKAGKGILVAPTVDGNTIVGPNAREVDDPRDTDTCAAGLAEVTEGAKRLMPDVNLRAVITSFAGVRATPDTGDFYIKVSEQLHGIIHAAGIESPGLASSPAIGEYVAGLLGEAGLELKTRENYVACRTKEGNHKRFRDMTDDEKAAAVEKDPSYGRIICRCETVTEGDILAAIHSPVGARSLDAVKRRVRAGMGRCQGGFCSPRTAALLSRELNVPLDSVTKKGEGSELLFGKTKGEGNE